MPIYINDNEQALFKGNEKTSVCMIHGSDMSIPNAYHFESCEKNSKIVLNNSTLVKNMDNEGFEDGVIDYRPWVDEKYIGLYHRNVDWHIANWTQKGVIRTFKSPMRIEFHNLQTHTNFDIKGGGRGYGSKKRRITTIPITSLGEGLFTSTDVDVLNLKKGTTDFTSEFYNEMRQFSYVCIGNESLDSLNQTCGTYACGIILIHNDSIFDINRNVNYIDIQKQICNEGKSRISGKNIYKEGYNALTHTYCITKNDYSSTPPYLWRYTYIVDATDLFIDKYAYDGNDNGQCWYAFHKSYITNYGDNYFEKYIRNQNNFYMYHDFQKRNESLLVTSNKNARPFDYEGDLVYFEGKGKFIVCDNILGNHDPSKLEIGENLYVGAVKQDKNTLFNINYINLCDLNDTTKSERKLLNVICKAKISSTGGCGIVNYAYKEWGEIRHRFYNLAVVSSNPIITDKRITVAFIGSPKGGSSNYKDFNIEEYPCKSEAVFVSNKINTFLLVENGSYSRSYNTMTYNLDINEPHHSVNVCEMYEKGVIRSPIIIEINGKKYDFDFDFSYTVAPVGRKVCDMRFKGECIYYTSETIPLLYTFRFSYVHLYFWLLKNSLITAPFQYSTETADMCEAISAKDDSARFDLYMPRCYEILMEFLDENEIKFFVDRNDYPTISEERIEQYLNEIHFSKEVLYKLTPINAYFDRVYPPILKIEENHNYDDYNCVYDIAAIFGIRYNNSEIEYRMDLLDIQIARDNK